MIKIGCHGIVKHGDKILLGKRNKKSCPFFGQYLTVGGTLDYMETTDDCFRREVKEETNLDIENLRVRRIREFIGDGVHKLIFIYSADYVAGDLKGADDCLDPQFFSANEIKKLVSEGKVASIAVENLEYLGEI